MPAPVPPPPTPHLIQAFGWEGVEGGGYSNADLLEMCHICGWHASLPTVMKRLGARGPQKLLIIYCWLARSSVKHPGRSKRVYSSGNSDPNLCLYVSSQLS